MAGDWRSDSSVKNLGRIFYRNLYRRHLAAPLLLEVILWGQVTPISLKLCHKCSTISWFWSHSGRCFIIKIRIIWSVSVADDAQYWGGTQQCTCKGETKIRFCKIMRRPRFNWFEFLNYLLQKCPMQASVASLSGCIFPIWCAKATSLCLQEQSKCKRVGKSEVSTKKRPSIKWP